MPHFKSENGQFFTGPSKNGPWTLRDISESRSPKSARPKPKEKSMSESGFDRAFRESERRRLREGSVVIPVDLDNDEIDELCRQIKELLQSRRGEGGKPLTQSEAVDRFSHLLDLAHREPTSADEALEQVLGVRAPGRHRRRAGEISNEEFLSSLMEGGGPTYPNPNPRGGTY